MLTRRHIRIKILQNLYSLNITQEYDIQKAENKLIKSVDNLYDLYIYQLSFIKELADFASKKIEERRNKKLPTAEDLNPNMCFVNNVCLKKISENKDLQREIGRLKISWSTSPEIIRDFYNQFVDGHEYQQYMSLQETIFNDDKKIIEILYFDYLLPSDRFAMLFDEFGIGWSDDLFITAFFIQKTFAQIKSEKPFLKLPPLFKNVDESGVSEDRKFMIDLQRKTLLHLGESQKMIAAHTKNWDFDRIPHLDVVILEMALTELQNFPTIPVKVTLNEYIDLTKMFSTPKSSVFVNGILDKLILELRDSGKINKLGRGLIDN